jgi:predicted nucleic-acid-binding Zn-ribbon protein
MAREECLWCEGRNIADGSLVSTGKVYFKAKEAKFWVFAENMVEIQARVCVDCGYVDLYADTKKLKKLLKAREK